MSLYERTCFTKSILYINVVKVLGSQNYQYSTLSININFDVFIPTQATLTYPPLVTFPIITSMSNNFLGK